MKYQVTIEIADTWHYDGFTLQEHVLQNAILDNMLPFAYPEEVKVSDIKILEE